MERRAKDYKIPWGAWYETSEELTSEVPDNWDVTLFDMQEIVAITEVGPIEEALKSPHCSQSILELAQGKKAQ